VVARGGDEVLAKMLLRNGANIHEKTRSGETALFMAVRAGHAAVVTLLFENGVNVHEKSSTHGVTPLVSAIRKRHKVVVGTLAEHGSIPEQISRRSDALMSVIETQQENIVTSDRNSVILYTRPV
jgi:ankyrin repeat protein